jgi:hypothetical protein
VFASVTAETAERAKRCPMCGVANHGSVSICQCGHEFVTDPAALRELVSSQRSVARAMIIGAVLLAVGGIALLVAMIVLSRTFPVRLTIWFVVAAIGSAAATARKGSRILHTTRVMLDELDERDAALPRARVVER